MQIRLDQLRAHLRQGLKPLYAIYCANGDEPLLVQEAADDIRAAARAAGHAERSVYTAAGAHFDWGEVLALSGAPYLQGFENVEGELAGNDRCGQATVFGFVEQLTAEAVEPLSL